MTERNTNREEHDLLDSDVWRSISYTEHAAPGLLISELESDGPYIEYADMWVHR